MKAIQKTIVCTFTGILAALACTLPARSEDKPCTGCHAAVTQKKVVHGAVSMGCHTCHGELDGSSVPHKSRNKNPKGLSREGPALCAACHDPKLFSGKVTHGPVTNGLCGTCHNPHGSDNAGLLKTEPAALCLDCHPDIKKGPHVIAGFSRSGHPLGNEDRKVPDPARPGKTFYCASCHEPHRSELPKLTRFPPGMESCQRCHQK